MKKEELFQKIDSLINNFANATLPTIYERTLYETDELLRSLFPKTDETYQNFIQTEKSSRQYLYKANIMTGILRGIKTRIDICENKKYQVFISSTYVDLIPYRNAVEEAIIFALCIAAWTKIWQYSRCAAPNQLYYDGIRICHRERDGCVTFFL